LSLNIKKIVASLDELKEKTPERKFKQSIELIMPLKDLDLKDPTNRINELIELPNPGKSGAKVCIFATGELAVNAKRYDVDMVFGREDILEMGKDRKAAKKRLSGYDFFISEAQLMPIVGRHLGQVLGPRGKMPTPVPPTVNISNMINRYKKMVRVRVRDQLNAQCKVGDQEMSSSEIAENISAVVLMIERKLEKGSRNIKAIYVKMTMGPTLKIET
jgi:large subunit ribosomal protein L1